MRRNYKLVTLRGQKVNDVTNRKAWLDTMHDGNYVSIQLGTLKHIILFS